MPAPPDRPTLLCAYDETPRGGEVLAAARWLAEGVGGCVLLAHVFDPMAVHVPSAADLPDDTTTEDLIEEARLEARAMLARAGRLVGDVELFAEGDPSRVLVDLVAEHDADLVVAGTAARAPLERILHGSVAADLVHRAICPVVVVGPGATLDHDGPVVAGYDGSPHSLRAARHAARLAARLGRELVLLHVVAPGEEPVEADARLAAELHAAIEPGLSRALEVTVTVELGDPVDQLVLEARDRDAALVVVGSRGRGAVSAAILGSVSAGMVRAAERPVMIAGPHSEDPAPRPAAA